MREVVVPERLLAEMRQHAVETYPDECCGFLLGATHESNPPGRREILAVQRASNEFEGERRRRFVIRPSELRSAEAVAERAGRAVVGFYHSHPDHPARPSAFDQTHAWPWYTYLVLATTATGVPAIGAFELDADSRTFAEVGLEHGPGPAARSRESL